jgi:hypothetical protein
MRRIEVKILCMRSLRKLTLLSQLLAGILTDKLTSSGRRADRLIKIIIAARIASLELMSEGV